MNYVGSNDPTLGNSLFGAVKLVKEADTDENKYSWYGIGFDVKGNFLSSTGGFSKNVITFRVDMSSAVQKKKHFHS